MSKGILYFVKNNEECDYAKQVNISAMMAKHFLKLPITVICSEKEELLLDLKYIDNVIVVNTFDGTARTVYDEGLNKVLVSWYNKNRHSAYELSPYDQTLLLDTDYLIQNSQLLELFKTNYSFAANCFSCKGNGQPESLEERRLNPSGPNMYWATAIYFKKGSFSEDVFSLMTYIKENWGHYKRIYNIPRPIFRNDYALTIAIHMLCDNTNSSIPSLPCQQINSYVPDRILEISNGSILVDNGYTPFRISRQNLHFMNKWNLESMYTEFAEVYDA